MDKKLSHFVEALLMVDWVHRNSEIVKKFQGFLLELLSAHSYYTKSALEKLMPVFKSVGCEKEWINGVPTEEEIVVFGHAHGVLRVLLQVLPMACDVLVQVVMNHFPYIRRPSHEHECFIYNMLKVTEYQPQMRLEFLIIIIKRLVTLDVYAPRVEVLKQEEVEECFDMDIEEMEANKESMHVEHIGMKHPVANNLDISMLQLFVYLHSECYGADNHLDWERTKLLYHDLVTVFEQVILSTHATHHIQFLLFYMCSFRETLAKTFLNYLWHKVVSPSVPSIVRQSAIMYMGSLLCRAAYINVSTLKASIAEMSTWIHSYIYSQDGLECMNSDVRVHSVFYTICQTLFYVIAFRHCDFVHTKMNLTFLQSLKLSRIVTCRLNPLKVCMPVVAQNFAAVTRTYQLAYCYTVLEHNARFNMPVIYQDHRGYAITRESTLLDTFFPFDPFVLCRCGHFIKPIYCSYKNSEQENVLNEQCVESTWGKEEEKEEDEDDFLTDQLQGHTLSNSSAVFDIYSYGSSPGFKWL
jgi:RNA polymerase I-specific transcription initiation factor RRN3